MLAELEAGGAVSLNSYFDVYYDSTLTVMRVPRVPRELPPDYEGVAMAEQIMLTLRQIYYVWFDSHVRQRIAVPNTGDGPADLA